MGLAKSNEQSAETGGSGTAVKPSSRGLRHILPVALLVTLIVIAVAFGVHRHFTLDSLVHYRASLADLVDGNMPLAVVVAAAVYISFASLSLPGTVVLTIACGFLFGTIAGGTIAVLSATIGATVLFAVARGSLGAWLRARAGKRLQGFADGLRQDAFNYLLFLRLVPIAPFWLVNLAPALVGVPMRVFVTSTAIGILPATFVFAGIGAGLEGVIAARADLAGCEPASCTAGISASDLVTPGLLASLAGLGVLALVPVGVRRWRQRARTR